MMQRVAISVLAVGVLALAAPAHAVEDFFLIAKEFSKPIPADGGVEVPMWGFAVDDHGGAPGACWNTISGGGNSAASKEARMNADACTLPEASVPGPRLVVPPAATNVRIRVVNLLSSAAGGEPISLVIPGQRMPTPNNPGPTWTDGSVGAAAGTPGVRRVRSFGREAAVEGGRRSYNWQDGQSNPLKDGTFLYHSGTHPQLQVQMGLYGAITRDAAAGGTAYDTPPADPILYDNEVLVLYSEVDTVLHDAVTSGTYGTTGPTSTFEYHPQHYLVNGEPFTTKALATFSGPAEGKVTLLRLLNAGLETHIAALQGLRMTIVAEDGNVYPFAHEESSAVLAALKTKDVILTPHFEGTHALYDGMLNLSSATDGSVSGMLSFLDVGSGTPPVNSAPVAVDDPAYAVNQNNPLAIAAPGVLGNDSDVDGDPLTAVMGATNVSDGTLVLNADGSFVYTPDLNFNGVDSFTYKASDGYLESSEATETITVAAVANNPPVADDKAVETGQRLIAGGNVEDVGIMLTGSDPDGNPLTFTVTGSGPTDGTLNSGVPPYLTYTPDLGFEGSDSFTYKANDGAVDSGSDAVVTIKVQKNRKPDANVDLVTTEQNLTVFFNITDNDTDPDPNGSIDPSTVVIKKDPRKGSLNNLGNGNFSYDPIEGKTGSDSFRYTVEDDDGEESARTKVRVNITP